MAHIIMITGGARSGKSTFAEELCLKKGKKLAYIATANIYDDEMRHRVDLHKKRRGEQWTNFEIPLRIEPYMEELKQHDFILVDCMTMLILNYMFQLGYDLEDDAKINQKIYESVEKDTLNFIEDFLNQIGDTNSSCVFVTNEIGLGIVPESKLSRLYRDIVGKANQILAQRSKEVVCVISGIPIKIKDVE